MSTDVLVIGTGQYVTGVLHGVETKSDKNLNFLRFKRTSHTHFFQLPIEYQQ